MRGLENVYLLNGPIELFYLCPISAESCHLISFLLYIYLSAAVRGLDAAVCKPAHLEEV